MFHVVTDVSFGALTDEMLDQEIATPENVTANLTFDLPMNYEQSTTAAKSALEAEGYSSNFMKNRQIMFTDYASCDGRPEYIVMSLHQHSGSQTRVSLTAGFTESGPDCDLRLEYLGGLIRLNALG